VRPYNPAIRNTDRTANLSRSAIVLLAAAFLLYGYAPLKSEAATINIYPGDDIQAKIETANPNDVVIFNPGEYRFNHPTDYTSIKPGVDDNSRITYILDDGVIISGSGLEHQVVLALDRGGFVNILGNGDATVRNTLVAISMGTVPFEGITISNINFEDIYDFPIGYQNREHPAPLEDGAFEVTFCITDGGENFIDFDPGLGASENSPWPDVQFCTIRNMSSTNGAIEIPTFYRDSHGGEWITLYKIDNTFFDNCYAAPTDPNIMIYFESPSHNAYRDVDEPFIGEPNDDNVIVDVNHFLPDGITPKRDSPMNLGSGEYIGAIEPYHELAGNLNFDEFVDFGDYAVAANRYDGNDYTEIVWIADDWLTEEPNDPNGNPK